MVRRLAVNETIAGSTPATAAAKRVGWASASPSGCNPPAPRCAGSTLARRTRRSVRASVGTKGNVARRQPGAYPWACGPGGPGMKPELKRQAIELRKQGYSYKEIERTLKVSRS